MQVWLFLKGNAVTWQQVFDILLSLNLCSKENTFKMTVTFSPLCWKNKKKTFQFRHRTVTEDQASVSSWGAGEGGWI